ncbi:MAG: DUF4386 domain-containing protein, partial [Bacteroidota bacterium]
MNFSNKQLARIAGFFYLLVIVCGLFSEVFVRQALRVGDNAIATALNIRDAEMLFRWGISADLVNLVFGLPCVLIVYSLFKSVNKLLASLALLFVVIQTAIIATNLLNQISPLLYLSNDSYLNTFSQEQLAALSLHALDLQAQGYGIALVFFGFYCLIIGYLIIVSNLIPRFLGVLYTIAGLCYLIN